jgi:hypothetical protein
MLPIDDDDDEKKTISDEDVQSARHAFDMGAGIARDMFRLLREQGVNNAIIHLLGLELSMMALEGNDEPATEGVRLGAISHYAHRILKNEVVIESDHTKDGDCHICETVADLVEDES